MKGGSLLYHIVQTSRENLDGCGRLIKATLLPCLRRRAGIHQKDGKINGDKRGTRWAFFTDNIQPKGAKVKKKFLMVALVFIISIAFVPSGFAHLKTAPKKAPVAKRQALKSKAEAPGFVGKVATINSTIITVKGQKATVTFDARNPKLKGYNTISDVLVDDTVVAKYTRDGVMITKLKGQTKKRVLGVKKAEPKKAQEKEGVSRITCTKASPCEVSVDIPRELTELKGVSLITCTKTKPCIVSMDKPREVRVVSRVTCMGKEPCSVYYNELY